MKIHFSRAWWKGFRAWVAVADGDINNISRPQIYDCCDVAWRNGIEAGKWYVDKRDRLKVKVFWLAPLIGLLWFIADRVGHFFGICLGR